MPKKTILLLFFSCLFISVRAQTKEATDTLPDYDVLFDDFAHFIDSLLTPRSFATINAGLGTGHFQYQTSHATIQEKEQFVLAPSAGYYSKTGFGISGAGSVMAVHSALTWYQTAATVSYDYLKNRKLLTGISFTRFFIKDSLPFYTSPLSNQVNSYFTYRGWWLKPAVAAAYGWGSVTSVEKRSEKLKLLKGSILTTQTTESISDFSVTASAKHDFYWLHILGNHDCFRLTPQVVITGGTQRYGLAQMNSLSFTEKRTTVFYNAQKNFVSSQSRFQLLALSGRLRAEYSKGIFFFQPQLFFDYYVPEKENKLATAFVINTGILF